jgi:hypothetical protein
MRTHTYWMTYEEYLAYGGVPPSTTIRGAAPYKRGLRGGNPVCKTNFYQSGVYGVATPYRVHIKFID